MEMVHNGLKSKTDNGNQKTKGKTGLQPERHYESIERAFPLFQWGKKLNHHLGDKRTW